jgi:hypothetical protein
MAIAPALPPGLHLIRVAAAVATLPAGNSVNVSGAAGDVHRGSLTITTINR